MKIKEQWQIENAYDIELLKAYNRQMDTIKTEDLKKVYEHLYEVEFLMAQLKVDHIQTIMDTRRRLNITRDTFDSGYGDWFKRTKE